MSRRRLMDVALERADPDLLVINARLINVYSAEIISGAGVSVADGRIAWVGRGARRAGPETHVIDALGDFLSPTFVDMHGHADFLASPVALAEALIPLGTTAMLTDTHDAVGALGRRGLELMLETTEPLLFHYYVTVPGHCPPLPEVEGKDLLPLEEFRSFFQHPRVLSVSELFGWIRLLQDDPVLLAKVEAAREAGLRLEGHMAGCSMDKLESLVALGVSSCHESISAGDVLERLRLGMATALRHGSIRADLDDLGPAFVENPHIDTSRAMLTPDWMSPQDVLRDGYLEHVVAKAIQVGIPPLKAYQMATINPATYLRVEHDIGGIGPGRQADMMLLRDLQAPRPHLVLMAGRVVARDGVLLQRARPAPPVPVSEWPVHRRPPLPVLSDAFRIVGGEHQAEIPGMLMVNKTITRPVRLRVRLRDGFLESREALCLDGPGQGGTLSINYLSVWSYLRQQWLTVVLSGFGAEVGGVATSVVHETHAPLVLGCDPSDMAFAVNQVFAQGGGVVLVEDGEVRQRVVLDGGGLLSSGPLEQVAGEMQRLNKCLRDRGCPWDDPFFGLNFLSFTGLPYVRLTPSGLLDSKRGLVGYP